MRRSVVLSLCGLLAGIAWAGRADLVGSGQPAAALRGAQPFATGEETLPEVKRQAPPLPRTDEPLGDLVEVGTTTYDYQANGSLSKMVAVSSDGVAHGSFMYSDAFDTAWADRRVRAWCVEPDLELIPAADVYNVRSGYTTCAVTSESPANPNYVGNSSVIAFHTGSPQDSWFGVDFAGCTHAFSLLQTSTGMLWPHVAMDGQDRAHVVNYDSSSNDIWYQATSDGLAWDEDPVLLTSTSEALGSICVGDKAGTRAAVLFHQKTGPEDIPFDMGEGYIGIQIHHDILAYIAEDGDIYGEYDAGNLHNLTSYGPGSTSPFGPYGNRAYCDVDGVFDRTEDHELHVAFTGGPQWSDTLHVIWDLAAADTMMQTYMHWNLGRGQIWHVNADTDEWSHVWGSNGRVSADDASWVDAGAWRMRNDRPSLAVDPESGFLYCVWNQYSDDDMGPIGPDGNSYPNGELLASCSADNGLSWSEPVNLTQTFSDGCLSGECMSESYHSVAEVADGYLHLTYVLDRCPGAIPFSPSECNATVNEVYYQRVPVDLVPPHAGEPWDAEGRVCLAQLERWYGWYAAAWCDDVDPTAALDSVKWIDPIHVLNESPYDVQVDHISWHHHELDQIGPPENLNITEVGMTVHTPDGYVPLEAWNGVLPQWRGTKFNAHFAYSGLTTYDVLIGFHFADGRPSLYYRLEMVNALQEGETEPCTGVLEIPVEDIGDFEETVLWTAGGSRLDPGADRPVAFSLEQNHPNPFNPATTIRYSLERGANAVFRVHNMAGQLVHEQGLGFQGTGWHQVAFDGSQLASGVYLYSVEAGDRHLTRKMVLAK